MATTEVLTDQEIQAAKQRIAELAAKADEETRKKRVAQKKTLVGEIETVETGKGGVKAGLKRFFTKGRTWEKNNSNNNNNNNNNNTSESPTPSEELKTIPKTLQDQKHVFENTEKSLPSLFAARSRGAPPSTTTATTAAATSKTSAPPPTAAEREAMNKLRPQGWDGKTYYSLVDLHQRNTPKTIDMKNREQYLSPDHFQEAFGMTKGAFCCLPKWKRDRLKQSLYLH